MRHEDLIQTAIDLLTEQFGTRAQEVAVAQLRRAERDNDPGNALLWSMVSATLLGIATAMPEPELELATMH